MVATFPHHMAVGLVTEYGDLLASNQVGDATEVLLGRHTTGRVVRRIEEDRFR